MEKGEWLALNTLSIVRSIVAGFFFLFVPLRLAVGGHPLYEVGAIIGIAALARTFSAPPTGALNDILGTKALLQAGTLLIAVGAALIGILDNSGNLSANAAAIALFWVANNIVQLSLEASLYKKTAPHDMAGRLGVFMAVKQLAWGIGPFAGGLMLAMMEYVEVCAIFAMISLLSVLLTLWIRHTAKIEFDLKEYVRELKRPNAMAVFAITFILAWTWGTENAVLSPLYLHAGLDQPAMGAVSLISNAGAMAGALLVGMVKGKDGKWAGVARKAGALSMLLCGAMYFAMPAINGFEGMAALRTAYNISEAALRVVVAFFIGTVFSESRVGGSNGAMNFVANLSMAAASFAAGILMQAGNGFPFYLNGAAMIAGALISWFFIRVEK